MKTIIYHHGHVPSKEVVKALEASLVKVPMRNADYFLPADVEKAENVIVDEGVNADAIRKAYEAAGSSVITVAEFLEKGLTKAAPAPEETEAPFDADAPRSGRKPGKKQGQPEPEPAE